MATVPLISEKAWAALLALAREAGTDALEEIVGAFLNQLKELPAKIQAAARDAKEFSALSHNLKSSAGGVGAEALSKQGEFWERASHQGKLPSATELQELLRTVTATESELRRRLAASRTKAA